MTYLLISSLLEGFQLTERGLPLSPLQMPPCVVGRLGRGTKESAQGGDREGKRDEAPVFPLFPSLPARLLFLDYCSVL